MKIEKLFNKKIELIGNFIFFNKDSTHQKQQQTNDIFSDKWEKVEEMEKVGAMENFQFKWYLELYGFKNEEELNRHSFVKCALFDDRILYCFRKSPSFNSFSAQLTYIRKVLGLIAYTKDFLIKISSMPSTPIEECESIEQMRIIENGFSIRSIDLELSQPSINEPHEVNDVLNYFKNNKRQRDLLKEVLNYINV